MIGGPLISIVLPSHDGDRFVAESIESCLRQTYPDWELILVDDGSTDRTGEIMARFAQGEPRLRLVRHRRNRGLPAALNSGFARARGEFLTWTSDDNLYLPDALATMLAFLRGHPGVAFCHCPFHEIDEAGRVLRRVVPETIDTLPERNRIGPCFLYRREVYETIGGYATRMRLVEDYDYWFRIAKRFTVARLTDVSPYLYRVHPRSLTISRWLEVQLQIARVRCRHAVPEQERDRFMLRELAMVGELARARRRPSIALRCDVLALAYGLRRRSPETRRALRGLRASLLAALGSRSAAGVEGDTRT